MKAGEYIEILPIPKRVIQIAVTDPGYETQYLYSNGEVWRWYWKYNTEALPMPTRVWEKVETP